MKFTNQTFTRDVTLDYNEFVDCELRDCAVFYYGGQFSLTRTEITNVKFVFGGAANRMLAFLRMANHNDPKLVANLLQQTVQPSVENVTIN